MLVLLRWNPTVPDTGDVQETQEEVDAVVTDVLMRFCDVVEAWGMGDSSMEQLRYSDGGLEEEVTWEEQQAAAAAAAAAEPRQEQQAAAAAAAAAEPPQEQHQEPRQGQQSSAAAAATGPRQEQQAVAATAAAAEPQQEQQQEQQDAGAVQPAASGASRLPPVQVYWLRYFDEDEAAAATGTRCICNPRIQLMWEALNAVLPGALRQNKFVRRGEVCWLFPHALQPCQPGSQATQFCAAASNQFVV
ncbi:hypothetical protein ABPG75_012130 [Micractinium tetrahymenae]